MHIFTLCDFASGWFHHVWLIDRVQMMKRPQLQKYQKGGKPICASQADSQSCSSPKASCVCCRLIYSSLQLECIGRLGRTLIQTTGSCLLRTCSESSGVRMMVAAGLRPARFVPQVTVRSLSVLWEARRAPLGTGLLFTRAARPLPSHQSPSTACAG